MSDNTKIIHPRLIIDDYTRCWKLKIHFRFRWSSPIIIQEKQTNPLLSIENIDTKGLWCYALRPRLITRDLRRISGNTPIVTTIVRYRVRMRITHMITILTRYVEICGIIGKYVNQYYRIAEEPLINVPSGHTCIYIRSSLWILDVLIEKLPLHWFQWA